MKIISWVLAVLSALLLVAAMSDLTISASLFFLSATITAIPIDSIRGRLSRRKLSNGAYLTISAALVFVGLIAIAITHPLTPERRAQIAAEERAAAAKERKLAQDKAIAADAIAKVKEAQDRAKSEEESARARSGVHCLSPWDGSHRALVAALKESLREPSSFEHIETKIAPVDKDGEHALLMKYRARNGFGGMNIEEVGAYIRASDCSIVRIVTK